MQAIKSDVKRNAPVLFAVQLDWSVTPFDMAKVPPLAIFNAYTLYTTEANREGRTWYGLRLGFFSDAVSAKQVAYYVRSDFKTVSVVPVTTIEKERATDINAARSGIYRAANIKEVAGADAAVHRPRPMPAASSSCSRTTCRRMIEQDVDGEMSPRFSKPAPTAPAHRPRPQARGRRAAALLRGARHPSPASRAPRGAAAMRTRRWTKRRSTRRWKFSARNTLEITNDSAGEHRRAPPARQDRQEGLEVRLADRSPVRQEISRAGSRYRLAQSPLRRQVLETRSTGFLDL